MVYGSQERYAIMSFWINMLTDVHRPSHVRVWWEWFKIWSVLCHLRAPSLQESAADSLILHPRHCIWWVIIYILFIISISSQRASSNLSSTPLNDLYQIIWLTRRRVKEFCNCALQFFFKKQKGTLLPTTHDTLYMPAHFWSSKARRFLTLGRQHHDHQDL